MPFSNRIIRAPDAYVNPKDFVQQIQGGESNKRRSIGVAATSTPSEDATHARAVGVLYQLSELTKFASELFNVLHKEVKTINDRVDTVQRRITHASSAVQATAADVAKQGKRWSGIAVNNQQQSAPVSSTPQKKSVSDLFSPNTRPKWLVEAYESAEKPADLERLDEFWPEEKRPCRIRFSDTDFFRNEWLRAEQKRQEQAKRDRQARRAAREQRREERKHAKHAARARKGPSKQVKAWRKTTTGDASGFSYDPTKAAVKVVARGGSHTHRGSIVERSQTTNTRVAAENTVKSASPMQSPISQKRPVPQTDTQSPSIQIQHQDQTNVPAKIQESTSSAAPQSQQKTPTPVSETSAPPPLPPRPREQKSTDTERSVPPPIPSRRQATTPQKDSSVTEPKTEVRSAPPIPPPRKNLLAEAAAAQETTLEKRALPTVRDNQKSIQSPSANISQDTQASPTRTPVSQMSPARPAPIQTKETKPLVPAGGAPGGLLAQIQAGKQLKKASAAPSTESSGGPSSGAAGGLLAQIRQGPQLRKTQKPKTPGIATTSNKPAAASSGGGDFGSGIAAILARRMQIAGDDDEESEEESDSDWSDSD